MIDSHKYTNGMEEFLQVHGWPVGLMNTLRSSCSLFPIRFFIVDDSGSMMTDDGHRIISHGAERR